MKNITVVFLIISVLPNVIICICPNITSRSEWGARPPTETTPLKEIPPPFVVIHHSAGKNCSTEKTCKNQVKIAQNYHMDTHKWDDIGYNFLVGGDGNVYEGRGWGIFGTHAPKYNARSIGICLLGSFMSEKPPEIQLQAVKDLISCAEDNNYITSDYHLIGHRQARNTLCPGDALFEEIKTWPHFDSTVHL